MIQAFNSMDDYINYLISERNFKGVPVIIDGIFYDEAEVIHNSSARRTEFKLYSNENDSRLLSIIGNDELIKNLT